VAGGAAPMHPSSRTEIAHTAAEIECPEGVLLAGTLELPAATSALVIFAHGSGSSRHSPRNRQVAHVLHEQGLGTLLFDLLTAEEEDDEENRELRFDIPFLAQRLRAASAWARQQPATGRLRLGYFGSSTGAAAALVAAADERGKVGAIVSRGGRPDLAGDALERVDAPTLLIVGGDDEPVVSMNYAAASRLNCRHAVEVIPGATHLFQELGALDLVAAMAARWFVENLQVHS
jgi:putative phosphoribosyl transferase